MACGRYTSPPTRPHIEATSEREREHGPLLECGRRGVVQFGIATAGEPCMQHSRALGCFYSILQLFLMLYRKRTLYSKIMTLYSKSLTLYRKSLTLSWEDCDAT